MPKTDNCIITVNHTWDQPCHLCSDRQQAPACHAINFIMAILSWDVPAIIRTPCNSSPNWVKMKQLMRSVFETGASLWHKKKITLNGSWLLFWKLNRKLISGARCQSWMSANESARSEAQKYCTTGVDSNLDWHGFHDYFWNKSPLHKGQRKNWSWFKFKFKFQSGVYSILLLNDELKWTHLRNFANKWEGAVYSPTLQFHC